MHAHAKCHRIVHIHTLAFRFTPPCKLLNTVCVYVAQTRRLNTGMCCKSTQRNECVHERVKYREMGCFNLTCRGYQVAKVAMTTKYKEDLLIAITTIPPKYTPTHSLLATGERKKKKKERKKQTEWHRKEEMGKKNGWAICLRIYKVCLFWIIKGTVHMETNGLLSFTDPYVSLYPYYVFHTQQGQKAELEYHRSRPHDLSKSYDSCV